MLKPLFDKRTKSLQDDAIQWPPTRFGCHLPGGHMKGLFPQYDYTTPDDHAETWKTALFVFDTNVLLNLYRYQARTREELLETLEKLSDRIWIPYHVALEFQRNRLTVIAAQGRRFSDIRKVIEKAKSELTNNINNLQLTKRHTLIDPEPLTTGFERLTADFLDELDRLQKSQQTLTAPDPIKTRIEEIFDGKVGAPFTTQDEVDKKNKEAESRFKINIPPGYMDKDKDKSSPDEFYHNGLAYKRKYGDYIVWDQLLEYASINQIKKLIFITDDAKEDWWEQIDFDGKKTVGPRVELIEEANRVGKLDRFLMSKPELFLKFANDFLAAEISEDTMREVRDVSSENKKKQTILYDADHPNSATYMAVANWILDRYSMLDDLSGGFPDFIANDGAENHAYIVHIATNDSKLALSRIIKKTIHTSILTKFTTLTVIFMVNTAAESERLLAYLFNTKTDITQDNIHIIVGQLKNYQGSSILHVYSESNYNDILPF
ncbi:PIN-like domain-containing protein [Pseudomonas pergaminensis]